MTVRGRRMKYKKVLAAVMVVSVVVLSAGMVQQRASNSKV